MTLLIATEGSKVIFGKELFRVIILSWREINSHF